MRVKLFITDPPLASCLPASQHHHQPTAPLHPTLTVTIHWWLEVTWLASYELIWKSISTLIIDTHCPIPRCWTLDPPLLHQVCQYCQNCKYFSGANSTTIALQIGNQQRSTNRQKCMSLLHNAVEYWHILVHILPNSWIIDHRGIVADIIWRVLDITATMYK